ncbi:MAG: S8 family peptidase [Verrucomicrobiales bacterium]
MKIRPPHLLIVLCLGAACWLVWRKAGTEEVASERPPLREPTPEKNLSRSARAEEEAREKKPRPEESFREELASRRNERIVTFKSDAAYQKAIGELEKQGFRILGRIDRLRALRVGYDELSRLEAALGDDAELARNYLVTPPALPEGTVQANAAGFGNDYLAWLGIREDHSSWGAGVTIAILDTGVVAHDSLPADFKQISLVEGGAEANGHGTAVASLASAVAPAADLLSVQIAGADGVSDSFTLAQGIFAALENGAQVINISMGSAYESSVVSEAIAAASAQGAVIVASSGNNGVNYATSPASHPDVISVGAVDANTQHLNFSNTDASLSTSAPGYEVYAAWPGDLGIAFTGTSASAPLTAGGVAAVLSQSGAANAGVAANLLLTYSNEAGDPGSDPAFGQGTIDVGRAVNHNTPGIYDLAVASQSYLVASTANASGLQVSIENRGTETLYNSTVNIQVNGQNYAQTIGQLAPAERSVITLPIGLTELQSGGSLSVTSSASVSGGTSDGNSANNSRSDVISLSTP